MPPPKGGVGLAPHRCPGLWDTQGGVCVQATSTLPPPPAPAGPPAPSTQLHRTFGGGRGVAWSTAMPRRQGCIRRGGASESAPEAVRPAVGGGCQSGWGGGGGGGPSVHKRCPVQCNAIPLGRSPRPRAPFGTCVPVRHGPSSSHDRGRSQAHVRPPMPRALKANKHRNARQMTGNRRLLQRRAPIGSGHKNGWGFPRCH